ncbi:hypothetical protein [Cellulosilyticum ruminicola]|uniref:hypothetical protein n=1 Tax=Cellulosilyticum ruminicola TaxID=425254 RepID=UPI0006CF26E7|nr:hypothetical protein [Cellulosilyticum ruminicola]
MYNKLLKHLGLFGILFMLIQLMKFGMFIVTNGYGMDYSVNEVRLDSILILGVAYLSYLWCIVKEKVVDGHKLHNIVGGLLVGLGRCITLIGPIYYIIKQYLMRADIWFGIILIGLIIFVYILMCIDYRREYERIINLEIYVFLVVAAIVINAFSSNRLSLLGIGFITVIGALSRNQASIDYLLERIQKNTPMVTGIRKSNLRRVLLLTLFLVVAYAFRNVVAGILRMLGHGFIYVLAAIIRFLFKSNEEIPLEVGGAAAIGLIGAPVPEGQGTWFKIICYILLAAFCIWRRKEIWNFVKCAYIGCIKRIKVILKWLNTALFHVEKKK